jgi:hypothetical protein
MGIPYQALSYFWGEAKITKTILCDGQRLEITENLHLTLWLFREEQNHYFIWVDAICINQADEEEKTEHVKMMKDIYTQVELVLAWLGPA